MSIIAHTDQHSLYLIDELIASAEACVHYLESKMHSTSCQNLPAKEEALTQLHTLLYELYSRKGRIFNGEGLDVTELKGLNSRHKKIIDNVYKVFSH